MSTVSNHANNDLIKFKREVTFGFIRNTRLARYQGAGINSIIRVEKDLSADGKQINVPIVDQLQGAGVGTGVLSGNEENIDNYGMPLWADWARHAVKWNKAVKKDASWNIREVATPLLSNWAKALVKTEMVQAFLAIPTATVPSGFRSAAGQRINGIPWASASAANKNAWLTANNGRIVFGNALGNTVAGNFASSAANVDTTNDRMTRGVVSMMKRLAQNSTKNKITPYSVEDGGFEMYVCFHGSRAFRDLKTNMETILKDAMPRESGDKWKQNPLFRVGDIIWDNVINTEIPEIDELLTLTGIGAGPSDVVPSFLCGVSALAYVLGQMPTPTRNEETDYQFNEGIGVEAQYGLGKVAKIPAGGSALVDWGVVTGFVSSVADA